MSRDAIKPLFIFSLPRSGSTLVQRVISSQEFVSTASEPWLLLLFIHAFKARRCYAEYDGKEANYAIHEFINKLPNGKAGFYEEVRKFAINLYTKASSNQARYFLDKTPRYHLISNEIIKTFSDGKFIILWRNPLSVAASAMETWGSGRWNLYRVKIDLYEGLESLIEAYVKNTNSVLAVRYEDLLNENDKQWENIFQFLDLPFDQSIVSEFDKVELKGRMGDPTGVKKYQALSSEPIDNWKYVLNNPIRKAWCKRYLRWIGPDRLKLMGYDYDSLIADIEQMPTSFRYMISDMFGILLGVLHSFFEMQIFKDKFFDLLAKRRIYRHN